jgi:hypothetical protein
MCGRYPMNTHIDELFLVSASQPEQVAQVELDKPNINEHKCLWFQNFRSVGSSVRVRCVFI